MKEYLVCLSIEPDCKLAETEAQKVNPSLDPHIFCNTFIKSLLNLPLPYCYFQVVGCLLSAPQ